MRTVLLALAGAATLSGLAGPVAAQSAADKADVRCLLVMQLAGRDPKMSEQVARGTFYYVGRLGARGPIARVEPIIVSEAGGINSAAAAKAELDRCAKELNQSQTQMQAVNQRLAARAKPAAAVPAAKR